MSYVIRYTFTEKRCWALSCRPHALYFVTFVTRGDANKELEFELRYSKNAYKRLHDVVLTRL